MNRYDADGMTRDMRSGRRIFAVYGTARDAQAAMEMTASRLGTSDHSTRIVRTNGAQKIEDLNSGGFIRFTFAQNKGQRGLSVDILYIDTDLSDDTMRDLIPSLQGSPHAEVLGR